MADGERFSILLVKKGASLPLLPSDISRFVNLEQVEGKCKHSNIPFKEWDEYLLTDAKADFRGDGIKIFPRNAKGSIRWIDNALMVLGIDGHGKLKINHRYCKCRGEIIRTKKICVDRVTGIRYLELRCPKCHDVISIALTRRDVVPPGARRTFEKRHKPPYRNSTKRAKKRLTLKHRPD